MSEQQQLYLFNRARLRDPDAVSLPALGFERQWIAGQLAALPSRAVPRDLAELRRLLAELIADEQRETPDSARYVAEHMTRDEFRILVQEFAIDGLTEAQVFYYALPRLAFDAAAD